MRTKNEDPVGLMRERIEIAGFTTTRGDYNEVIKTWSVSNALWAQVIHKATGTDEVFTADQKSPDAKVDFRIRFRDVKNTDEVIYRGQRYKIEGLIPSHLRDYLTIETKQLKED